MKSNMEVKVACPGTLRGFFILIMWPAIFYHAGPAVYVCNRVLWMGTTCPMRQCPTTLTVKRTVHVLLANQYFHEKYISCPFNRSCYGVIYTIKLLKTWSTCALWPCRIWSTSFTNVTKSFPEPMLNNHQWGLVIFTWMQFHRKC